MERRKKESLMSCSPEDFSRDLNALQEKIGYTFKNKGLLVQALTDPSCYPWLRKEEGESAAEHHTRVEIGLLSSNKPLETRGDHLLKQHVQTYIQGITRQFRRKYNTTEISNSLNSNWYLSTIGMSLSLDRYVRRQLNQRLVDWSKDRGLGYESAHAKERRGGQISPEEISIRITSNTMEALIGAMEEDEEGAGRSFIERFILPRISNWETDTSLIRYVIGLSSKDESEMRKSFAHLTGNKVSLCIERSASGEVEDVYVRYADASGESKEYRYISKGRRGGPSRRGNSSLIYWTATGFFKDHPWALWKFDGRASIFSSEAVHGKPYGEVEKEREG